MIGGENTAANRDVKNTAAHVERYSMDMHLFAIQAAAVPSLQMLAAVVAYCQGHLDY